MFELSRTKMAVVPSWHGGAQHAVWETSSHYVWFRIPHRESEDWYVLIYWIILICTDVLLTSHQWTLAILPGPWSCHLNCVGLRLEACLSLHLPTQLQSVLWDEDYAGTRHYEGKRRYHPLASYSASYYFILFPVASAPYTALCKMSTLEAFWFAHSVSLASYRTLTGEAGSSLKSPAPDTKGQERWKQIYINIEIVIES